MIQILLYHRIPEKSKGSDKFVLELVNIVRYVKKYIFLTYTVCMR